MKPWKPWDATEDEYADLLVIREQVPPSLSEPLQFWMRGVLERTAYNGVVDRQTIHNIETAFRVQLSIADYPEAREVVQAIAQRGNQFILRIVDYLLSDFQPVGGFYAQMPEDIATLSFQMDQCCSAVEIVVQDGVYRITRRLPEGVEVAAQAAINDANVTAGHHLATAWREMQSFEPDASKILREGIQAVEAAAGEKVIPNDKKPQLPKIVGALRQQKGWTIAFARRDDDYPDHLAVLIGMLETLAFAEQFRHSGHGYSQTEAQGHVQLAATLVGWFSTDVVVREQ